MELSSPHALGAVTSLALAACAAAQREARFRSGDARTLGAMCGFVDPWETLYAPSLARHAVDSTRLIVVRPPLGNLARVAVRMAESKAFSVLSVDLKGVPGASTHEGRDQERDQTVALERWSTVVRRLAIAPAVAQMSAQSRLRRMHCRSCSTMGSARQASAQEVQTAAQS